MSETTTETYDPIPDLAMLLCSAQRLTAGETNAPVQVTLARLCHKLGISEFCYPNEAAAAIRAALANLALVAAQDSTGEEQQR